MNTTKKKSKPLSEAEKNQARRAIIDKFMARKNADADAFVKKHGLPKQVMEMQKKRMKEMTARFGQA